MWAPDYIEEFKKRILFKRKLDEDKTLQSKIMRYYVDNPIDWINDWCVTYDPRNKPPKPRTMPFILFERQKDLVRFIKSCIDDGESGLCEKSRDMGASWVCCAVSCWLWLFHPGSAVGWGSRKEQLVDKLGDPDSLFVKMRMILSNLPPWMLPRSYDERVHATYMKIINPENGASITGEAGDNIGRGGRKLIYFKDESAHYERPEMIEAALGDNTDVQIDISSVNGSNNIFYRRRMSGEVWTKDSNIKGVVRVFLMDWRDHPLKTQEWYEKRRSKAEGEGLLHVFSQEVDRDYSSSIDRVLIHPAWVKAAIDAHKILGFEPSGSRVVGLDVADEGGDKNAIAITHGPLLRYIDQWGEGDVGETARKAFSKAKELGCDEFYYDSIGVGAGVKSEANRMKEAGIKIPRSMPWNAGLSGSSLVNAEAYIIANDRDSPKNKDFFKNLKAQGWWNLKTRFEKTYKAVTKGEKYDSSELISLDKNLKHLDQAVLELSQAQINHDQSGKMMIDKKPSGAKSPNLADAIVIAFTPIRKTSILDVI